MFKGTYSEPTPEFSPEEIKSINEQATLRSMERAQGVVFAQEIIIAAQNEAVTEDPPAAEQKYHPAPPNRA